MKKIILICLLVIVGASGFGQSVVQRASPANTVDDPNGMNSRSKIIPRYQDTLQANTLYPTLDSAGKIIYTRDIKGFWYRQDNPKKWVRAVSDNNLSNNFFFDSTCNCYKIDTTSLMNIINNFNGDSSITSITVVNDSTIRICYGNGTCVNIGITTTINNISNVYWLGGDTIAVCAITVDTTSGTTTTVCDTLTIGTHPTTTIYQNALTQTGNIVEFGGNLIHPTTVYNQNSQLTWHGNQIYNYPWRHTNENLYQLGTGLDSWQGKGNFINCCGFGDGNTVVNNSILGIQYIGGAYSKNDPILGYIPGYLGDSVKAYTLGSNWHGGGSYGSVVDDYYAKTTAIALHVKDTNTTYGISFYAAPQETANFSNETYRIVGGNGLGNYRRMTVMTDGKLQLPAYNSSNFIVNDTGKYKIAVIDTLDGTVKKGNWLGGGGGGTEDTAVIYGNWVDQIFPGVSLPTGWTYYTSAPTVSNGLILTANGSSIMAAGFTYMNSNYTASLNYTQTTDFILNTAPTVDYLGGFFVGRRSANTSQQCQNAIKIRRVDASHWRAIIYTMYGAAETAQDSTGTITMAINDTFRIYSAWSQTNIYVRIAKLTAGVETETAGQVWKYNYDATLLQQPANTGAVWMGAIGTTGQYKVIHYTETHYDPTNSELLIVGNSIATRYNASNLPSHWSHLAFDKADINWGNTSGGGDRFNEFNLRLNEIYAKTRLGATVLVEGGTNDNASDLRTQAVPFFDSLIAHNRRPVFLKMFNVTAKDTVMYNICNERGVKLIDAGRANIIVTPTGDAHPNDNGNQTVAYIIQSELPDITKHTGGNELSLPTFEIVIDTTAIRSGSRGRLLFESATNKVSESPNLFYDIGATNYLGVGAISPKSQLDVAGSVRIEGFTLPASGQALLLSYTGGVGYIYNYNSSGSVYGDLSIGGAGHVLLPSLATSGSAPSTTGTTKMVISDQNGLLSFANIPTGGFTTADNGLTASTSTNVQLGGTLLTNTTITTGTSTLNLSGTSGTSLASYNDTGTGSAGSTSSGIALAGNGIGGGLPLYLYLSNASASSIGVMATIQRSTSGTAAAGLGGSINYDLQTSTGGARTMNQLISKLTDATDATRTAQFNITGVTSGTTETWFTVGQSGYMQLRYMTATEASAITPANGMIVCVSSTDATFTSIGFWGYSNGAWAKF